MSPAPPVAALRRALAWTLVLLSASTLVWSYSLPTVTFQTATSPLEVYSIWGGIESLWQDGNWILATIVFLFSMVFPVIKLLALAWILSGSGTHRTRLATAHWLELLGKWSMLDVFVVGAFVGSIQIGLATATSRPGIYVFALAITLSMLSTLWVGRLESGGVPRALARGVGTGAWHARLLSTVAAATLAGAFAFPLLVVEKAALYGMLFVKNEVDLPGTTWSMTQHEEVLLALTLGVWVLAAPALRALLSLRLRWFGGGSRATLRAAFLVDEWAMLDVFGLGLVIVWVKLDELATTTLLPGFWLAIAARPAAAIDAWQLRRSLRPARQVP